jgi:pimeloyl-ACP methyl ester carboxylesterase
MEVPDVKFATSEDGVRIAYQAWGDGPTLVIAPALLSNVEVVWESELIRRALERLGRYLRVIQFDKRGLGLSDRFDDHPTNEQRTADFLAVMDAEGVKHATISGVSEGGVMAVLLAAEHPERVERLIIANSVSPYQYWDRLERLASVHCLDMSEVRRRWEEIADNWASDPGLMLGWLAPSQSDNEPLIEWVARLQRLAATQDAIRRQIKSVFHLDAGDAPTRVQVPTLILHSVDDRVLDVGHGRILAELIPNSRLVEVDNDDHFWWLSPSWKEFTDAYIEFTTGSPPSDGSTRKFGAVLFTDIVGSTSAAAAAGDDDWHVVLDSHARICDRAITGEGGRLVKSTGDGVLAMFDSPSAAVEAARRLRADLEPIGIEIRGGIHAGEVEIHDDGDISGLAVNLAARVEQAAPDGEIYVSSTVRDLLLGGSHRFEDRGDHDLKGIDGRWTLCRVT